MIYVDNLILGDYETNCYLVRGEGSKNCLVIDPGYTPELVLERIRTLGLSVGAIALTHGHFDHVGGVRAIHEATRCPVYIHEGELNHPQEMTAGPLCYTDLYEEGEVLSLAGLEVTVLSTPGHTPGSVCLLAENALFTGDTLFAGSCGRVDLPGGNGIAMLRSLERLGELDYRGPVYPGHGEATTLNNERKYNPYMRGTI